MAAPTNRLTTEIFTDELIISDSKQKRAGKPRP